MSPTIHTAAFRYHHLPYTYEILQTKTVDELDHVLSAPDFGGASVTMPHKLGIGKFCDEITDQAKIIGAVNTLVVSNEDEQSKRKSVIGENTDWSGLVACIQAKGGDVVEHAKTGLVIGAGGASRAALYALHTLGVKDVFLFNRTRSKAEKIAQDFSPIFEINVLSDLAEFVRMPNSMVDIIIGTIPADQTSEDYFPVELFANGKGICVDMAYKPRLTNLLRSAGKALGWRTVTGVEVLLEQAFAQSHLWLGLPVPKDLMVEELERFGQRKVADTKERL